MKLTKEQIQKIIMGGIAFCGVIYAYYAFLLGPLVEQQVASKGEAQALEPKIQVANTQLARAKALEAKSPECVALMDSVQAMIPVGSPIAWVPTKLADTFKSEGIDKTSTRMAAEIAEKDLTGFSKLSWTVEVPAADFISFAKAVARLENEEPLMEVFAFEIEAGKDDIQKQRSMLTVHNIVRL